MTISVHSDGRPRTRSEEPHSEPGENKGQTLVQKIDDLLDRIAVDQNHGRLETVEHYRAELLAILGFTKDHVGLLRDLAELAALVQRKYLVTDFFAERSAQERRAVVDSLADRIEALLPPEEDL